MKEFQDKRKTERRLYSKFTIVVLVIILLFLIKGTWDIYQKDRQSLNDLAISNKELADLQSRNDYLSGQVAKLETTSGQEEEIRQKFQVAKPGENVIIIVPSASGTVASSTPGGVFGGIWEFIKNLF